MKINPMIYAGSWYPQEISALDKLIEETGYQTDCLKDNLSAAVLPHAGLYYSIRGMLPFFENVNKNKKLVIILASSHNYYLEDNSIYYGDFDYHETPYRNLKSASAEFFKQGNRGLSEGGNSGPHERFFDGSDAIIKEHAIEMFLPLIAKFLNEDVMVAPFLCGKITDLDIAKQNAQRIIEYVQGFCAFEDLAIIASSDFSHYGRRFGYAPFKKNEAEEKVKEQDLQIAQMLVDLEVKDFLNKLGKIDHTICGINPAIYLKLLLSSRNIKGKICDYYNSNDITQTRDESFVAYCSILF